MKNIVLSGHKIEVIIKYIIMVAFFMKLPVCVSVWTSVCFEVPSKLQTNDNTLNLVDKVFANGPVDQGSIPGGVTPKTLKCYLIHPCLTLGNIGYVSRVKWSNPGKEYLPSLHLGVVAIEKGAFMLPSTTVANFTYRS